MTLMRALLTATLTVALVTPAWSQRAAGGGAVPGVEADKPSSSPATGLLARQPLPKRNVIIKPEGESRLLVKFVDSMKARATADGQVQSLTGQLDPRLEELAVQFNLRFRPAILTPEPTVDEILNRAAALSRKAQPDLLGAMYIEGHDSILESAARAINNLECVEYIYFELPMRPARAPGGGDPTGACCVPIGGSVNCVDGVSQEVCETAGGLYQGNGSVCGVGTCDPDLGACCIDDENCVALTEVQCTGLGGSFKGIGQNCVQDEVDCALEGCGEVGIGDCFIPHPNPFCDNEECCDLVGDLRPFCVDEDGGQWDVICVAIAHLFCEAPPADRCSSLINGNCFEQHTTGGCVDNGCCNIVCALDSFCCETEWDEGCVALAEDNCVDPNGTGPTPDFTNIQGYLRAAPYAGQPGGVPPGLALPAPLAAFGSAGHGFELFAPTVMVDSDSLTGDERYLGLYGLGRQLEEEYGVGVNRARGRGVKVAVIEWAFYKGHEDLEVISEPGQTLIMIPAVSEPQHATACLGIIGATENGFGMTGIAPDAELYFFPLTSIEQGAREHTAWTNALARLSAGDVISASYGPGNNNLNTVELTWTLIRLASDLGITCCIAAGNDCFNLDDAEDFGDSGGIVVGAGTPGRVHSRLVFSNFYRDGTGTQGNIVHFQGWGESVPSLGGSANSWFPNSNWNRSYCNNFNGTSAAAPMAAGVVACLQGLARQFYGIPLTSAQIRGAITGTGFPQAGNAALGFDDSIAPCGPDVDPDQPQNRIGPFPRPYLAGAFILAQTSTGFDEAPLVDDVLVIRGNHRFGNKFSIKASDNNYLVVDTLFTQRKHRPNIPGPASRVTYLGTGQVADIMVTAHLDTEASSLDITIETAPPGPPALHFVEVYDWTLDKWSFVGFSQFTEGGGQEDVTETFTVNGAQRFVNRSAGNEVLVRSYVLAVGGNPLPTNPAGFTMRWDLVNIETDQGFGVIVIPPPAP